MPNIGKEPLPGKAAGPGGRAADVPAQQQQTLRRGGSLDLAGLLGGRPVRTNSASTGGLPPPSHLSRAETASQGSGSRSLEPAGGSQEGSLTQVRPAQASGVSNLW